MFERGPSFRPAFLLLAALVLIAFVTAPALAKKKAKFLERYTARAVAMSNLGAGTSTVDVAISRWSTDEERAALIRTIVEGQRGDLVKALQKQKDHGFVKFQNTLGRTLRYAREFKSDSGRRILLVTDRPIESAEISASSRTLDYDVSIVELRLDNEGKGEGSLAVAVELTYDKEKNELIVKHYASEPIRLTNVRPR